MWRRHNEAKAEAKGVIGEAERLLNGRAVDSNSLRGRRVSVRGLVSVLAHGERHHLRRLCNVSSTTHPGSWAATLGYLATELLAMAPDDATLLRIQRQVLVPLELRLLGGEIPPPSTPARLATLVVHALAERQMHPEF